MEEGVWEGEVSVGQGVAGILFSRDSLRLGRRGRVACKLPCYAGAMKTVVFAVTVLMTSAAHAQAPTASVDPAIEKVVIQVLQEYMDGWNRMDVVAWERTFHFPHYRLASGRMQVLDRPGLQNAGELRQSAGPEWDHSSWTRLRIIHASADKVHVDTRFTRYRKDGSAINSFDSLYVVTKEQGRWGVKLRSSMAP